MNIPRLRIDQLPPYLAEALRPRVERLGYLGEFFGVTANVPRALAAFNDLTTALKDSLPDELTEVVALTVASRLENAYERNQHEQLALKLGLSGAWIADVECLDPDNASELTSAQRATQRLALAVLADGGHGTRALVDALVVITDAKTAVGVLMLVGRYVSHAFVVNALELAPPVAGIFPLETVA